MTEKTKEELDAESKAAEEAAKTKEKGAPAAEPKNTETMIPKARFDEVNEKAKQAESENKKLREELDERKKAEKVAEEKRLTENQQYKELAEKRQQELEDLQKQREADKADAEAKAKRSQYETSVIAEASALDFADPKDALSLLGEVEDPKAALQKLAEEKPYLLKDKKAQRVNLRANKVNSESTTGETREERLKRLQLR